MIIGILHSLTGVFGAAGDACQVSHGNFLSFPTWYAYLDGQLDGNNTCIPTVSGLNDIWLIVAAVIEILLRFAALAAVAAIIYSGFQYTTSQGNPEQTARAKGSLVNALVGLAISVMAAAIITFIARSIS
jgi:hypothetical protein